MEKSDVVRTLMQAFHRFRKKEMESNKDHRRNEAWALVLLSERTDRGMRVSELSRMMRVTSPFATQLINQLEERGLVLRRTDGKDRRVVNLVLTEQGRQEAEDIIRTYHRRFAALVEHLGEDEARTLARLLNQTFDFMDEQRKSAHGGGRQA